MTERESKARRLLRQLAYAARMVLELTPRSPGYAQNRLKLAELSKEADDLLGPPTKRRPKDVQTRIDVPNPTDLEGPWVMIDKLNRSAALKYVQERFGADDKGRISLLTDLPEGED